MSQVSPNIAAPNQRKIILKLIIPDISEHRTGHHRTMTVKTISRVEAPLSDLLVAMTICNTASFDESIDSKKGNNNKEGKVRINMPTLDENGELSK